MTCINAAKWKAEVPTKGGNSWRLGSQFRSFNGSRGFNAALVAQFRGASALFRGASACNCVAGEPGASHGSHGRPEGALMRHGCSHVRPEGALMRHR